MATSRPAPPPPPPLKFYDLEITIVSAKHLKNVNWRNGDLKPYAIFWLDPDHRLATKSDDSGSTRPVWNERFILPLNLPLHESALTSEIFHSKPSDLSKPLVGTLRIELRDIHDLDDFTRLRTFDLRRPSGRPHGKIRLKLAVQERPSPPAPPPPSSDYRISPQSSYYYSAPPPPPPPRPLPPPARDYRGYSPPPPPHGNPYGSYADPYSSYYSGYYSQPPPPPPRPFFDQRQSSYGGPSAPVDYTPYDQKPRSSGKMGFGSGLAVGAVAGGLGGLALEEGLKYEDEKIDENDLASRTDYNNDYRRDY